MVKIKIIVIDQTKTPFLKGGETFYLERVKRYTQVEWVEIRPEKIKKGRTREEVLFAEGEAIARRLGPKDYLVTLDQSGHQLDSLSLYRWLNELSTRIGGWVCFIIGGPLGLSDEILRKANKCLSLSLLTLTHEMSRLLLLEQIYRSLTIWKGEKYHK